MANTMQGGFLSGPTAEELSQSIYQQKMQQAMSAPNQGMAAGMVLGNLLTGAGEKLLGAEDPRVSAARKFDTLRSSVVARAQELGIDPAENPEDFMKLTSSQAVALGMPDLALQTATAARQMRMQREEFEMKKEKTGAEVSLLGSQTKFTDAKTANEAFIKVSPWEQVYKLDSSGKLQFAVEGLQKPTGNGGRGPATVRKANPIEIQGAINLMNTVSEFKASRWSTEGGSDHQKTAATLAVNRAHFLVADAKNNNDTMDYNEALNIALGELAGNLDVPPERHWIDPRGWWEKAWGKGITIKPEANPAAQLKKALPQEGTKASGGFTSKEIKK